METTEKKREYEPPQHRALLASSASSFAQNGNAPLADEDVLHYPTLSQDQRFLASGSLGREPFLPRRVLERGVTARFPIGSPLPQTSPQTAAAGQPPMRIAP
jgi:hypothetical protein